MKIILFLFVLFFSQRKSPILNQDHLKVRQHYDSTLHQRFIVSVLCEFNKDGRWVFTEVDSCDGTPSYEVVHPINIYKSYLETFNPNIDSNFFVTQASIALNNNEAWARCAHADLADGRKRNNYIRGVKVNMHYYNEMSKLSVPKILSKYFDANKRIKKQYMKVLYELIAVGYNKNVKVITYSATGNAIYEI